MKNLEEISEIITKLKSKEEVCSFLLELLTDSEVIDISKRWRILKMLSCGSTQREISSELKVSLCKVTRGAKIIKDKNAIITKYLKGV